MRKLFITTVLLLGLPVYCARADDIAGQVLGADGKPVADALVVVSRADEMGERLAVTLQSDDQGKFSTPSTARKYGEVSAYKSGVGFSYASLAKKPPYNLQLRPGVTVHGLLKDGAGKPVPNTIVRLEYVMTGTPVTIDDYQLWRVPEEMQSIFSARTGEDGKWVLNDVPTGDTARIVMADERFVTLSQQVKLSGPDTEAPALVAKPAAIVTGSVVYEDGKPAAGVKIYASGSDFQLQSYGQAQSGADGSFRVTGLGAGSHKIYAYAPTDEWIPLNEVVVAAKTGQSVAAPNVVMSHGGLVQGTVTDAQTGAPLANVSIGGGSGSKGGKSDEKGHYSLRVWPGEHGVYVMGNLPEYLDPPRGSPSKNINLTVGKNEVKTLDFKLTKGLKYSGQAVDEAGKPVADVRLTMRQAEGRRPYDDFWERRGGASDADGRFEIVGIAPGSYNLAAGGDWQVVSPEKIDLQQDTQGRAVLRISKALMLEGRVVDSDGAPVASASVLAYVSVPRGGGSYYGNQQEIKSDKDGRFSIGKLRPDYRVKLQASKAGYRYVSGGGVSNDAAGFHATDIVLQPLTAKLEGRVTDAAGQPVAGAFVLIPGNGLASRVSTDAEGKFALSGLAPGEAVIVAAHASGVLAARRRLDVTPDTLVLRPAPAEPGIDAAGSQRIIEDDWMASRGYPAHIRQGLIATQAVYDLQDALAMAREENGQIDDETLQRILQQLMEDAPVENAEWMAGQVGSIKDAYMRLYFASKLALAVAKEKGAVAASLYDFAVNQAPADDAMSVKYRLFMLAATAARIGKNEEAEEWYRQAVAQLPAGAARNEVLNASIDSLAAGSAALAEKALLLIDDDADQYRLSARRSAVAELVKYDVPAALQMLEKIKDGDGNQQAFAFGDAAVKVIDALGLRDPQAALALARRVTHDFSKSTALAHAASYQPKESALALLREAYAAIPGQTWRMRDFATVAGQAYQLDKATGADLLADAHDRFLNKLQAEGADTQYSWRRQQGSREIAAFALAYRSVDPIESRLLLEDEFAYQTKVVPEDSRSLYQVNDLIIAMATIDFQRARELTRDMPLANQWGIDLSLVKLLRTAPEERQTLLSRF